MVIDFNQLIRYTSKNTTATSNNPAKQRQGYLPNKQSDGVYVHEYVYQTQLKDILVWEIYSSKLKTLFHANE